MSRSKALRQTLADYPLAPYVAYHMLSNSLAQTSPAEIDAFRERYPELPATPLLYQRWLKVQGQRRQWQRLHARRYDTSNAELQCYFVRAQYGVGEKSTALDATTALWSRPKSQPKPVTRSLRYGEAPTDSAKKPFGSVSKAPWRQANAFWRGIYSGI